MKKTAKADTLDKSNGIKIWIKRTHVVDQTAQYYFIIKGRNGKIIATSETYTQKRNAIAAANLFHFPVVDMVA